MDFLSKITQFAQDCKQADAQTLKLIEDYNFYISSTGTYNSSNTRNNPYYPQHLVQQNTINQLTSQIALRTDEYSSYTAQILNIDNKITIEDSVLGKINDYLEDFE